MEKEANKAEYNSQSKDGDSNAPLPDDAKPRRPRRERNVEIADEKVEEAPTAEANSKPRRKRGDASLTTDVGNVEPVGGGGWMTSPEKKTASKLSIEEDDDNREVTNPNNKDKFFQEGGDGVYTRSVKTNIVFICVFA